MSIEYGDFKEYNEYKSKDFEMNVNVNDSAIGNESPQSKQQGKN